MSLDVKGILKHIGCTREELCKEINWTLEELSKYENDEIKLSGNDLEKLIEYTGLTPDKLRGEKTKIDKNNIIKPDNTWSLAKITKNSLIDYIKEGLDKISEKTCTDEIKKIEMCIKTLRKPRISFAGQSDVGKSTLINALLGADKMPAKWTPTTSIVVYIKHLKEKPKFIKNNVCIFKKHENEYWNDTGLDDQEYYKKFLIKEGDYSLLESYGTHQSESKNKEKAYSAVAFIDSPLLEVCDILDLPGFAANEEDDALQKFNTRENETDILIYLSRSNGFLQDRDIAYLQHCLYALSPLEKSKVNKLGKLENLFVIASQSNAVNNGDYTELEEILDLRCNALCKPLREAGRVNNSKSLLYFRSKLTDYEYNEEDIRRRFFTYEKDTPRLSKKFNKAFTSAVENIAECFYENFNKAIEEISLKSTDIIRKKIDEYKSMIYSRELYYQLYKEIKENEPARRLEQEKDNEEMLSIIDNYRIQTREEAQNYYNEFMTEDTLIQLIDNNDYKNKKSDKEEFIFLVGTVLNDKIRNILSEKSDILAEDVNHYLAKSSGRFDDYCKFTSDYFNIDFDVFNLFARTIAGIGLAGAIGAWFTTSASASGVMGMFGAYAGFGSILAVGGMVTLGIGAIITGIISLVKVFTWKKDLAKLIIKEYNEKDYISSIFIEIDKYWNETARAFKQTVRNMEEEWQKKIEEYKKCGDADNLIELKNKLENAKEGLNFFIQMSVSKNG